MKKDDVRRLKKAATVFSHICGAGTFGMLHRVMKFVRPAHPFIILDAAIVVTEVAFGFAADAIVNFCLDQGIDGVARHEGYSDESESDGSDDDSECEMWNSKSDDGIHMEEEVMDDNVKKAKHLKDLGCSSFRISEILGVSESDVRSWTGEVEVNNFTDLHYDSGKLLEKDFKKGDCRNNGR